MADNFTTASALAGRVPESIPLTGDTWIEAAGHWAVRNGYLDPPNSPNAVVLFPTGKANVDTTVAVTITSAYQFGAVVRAAMDGSSYLFGYVTSTNQAVLARRVGNSTTVLNSMTLPSLLGTFTLGVRVNDTRLSLYRDGIEVLWCTVAGADLTTPTYAGLWVSSSGNERLDDVRMTTVV